MKIKLALCVRDFSQSTIDGAANKKKKDT